MVELFDPLKAREALQEDRKAAHPTDTPPEPEGAVRAPDGDTEGVDGGPLKADFRVFLVLIWRHLNLPDPTPLQLSIAWYLQHGPQRSIIQAFRGAAKSWITAAYVLWLLYCDPQKKVLVTSGSLKRAVAFTQFCLTLIREVPALKHLHPTRHQRQSSQAFDVGPALPDQSPSFHAAGVMSQVVGFRGDAIVPDDAETNTNSITVLMREKLREAVKEYESILKPGGLIKFLGTPHDVDSLYNHLEKVGYVIRIWPARYPSRSEIKAYGNRLAPFIRHQLKHDPALVGHSTEPTRFTDEDLAKRELSIGRSEFTLQFMLSTGAVDANRYPLKLTDLIVMGLDPQRGPDLVSWGKADDLVLRHLPAMGFAGDHFHRPANVAETYSAYTSIIAAIDSSGRGLDETALIILAELHGILYLLHGSGYRDGYSPDTLTTIAKLLVRFRASFGLIEANFGDGMFLALLQPYVLKEWQAANKAARASGKPEGGTRLEEIRSGKAQKELRILSVLEPITQQHRLVVNVQAVEEDYASIRSNDEDGEEARHRYSLFYQYARLTRDRNSLQHDDRLETLALAASHYALSLGVSPLGMARNKEEERQEEELERMFADTDEIGGHPAQVPSKDRRLGEHRPANLRPGKGHRGGRGR